MVQLKQTVALLQQISWSSLVAEQQHGSLANLKKYHPEYELSTLASRAFGDACYSDDAIAK